MRQLFASSRPPPCDARFWDRPVACRTQTRENGFVLPPSGSHLARYPASACNGGMIQIKAVARQRPKWRMAFDQGRLPSSKWPGLRRSFSASLWLPASCIPFNDRRAYSQPSKASPPRRLGCLAMKPCGRLAVESGRPRTPSKQRGRGRRGPSEVLRGPRAAHFHRHCEQWVKCQDALLVWRFHT